MSREEFAFLANMTEEGLRWDLYCNIPARAKDAIRRELARRGKSEHGLAVREGGPFVPGMPWTKVVAEGSTGSEEEGSSR